MSDFWRCKNPFYRRVSFNEANKTLYIYNYGCNWDCIICTYRIKLPEKTRIALEEIMDVMDVYARKGLIQKVRFLGGEPLINPHLKKLAKFADSLNLTVGLGHTNLSMMPPPEVTELIVGIKAYSPELHKKYTGGFDSRIVFSNIKRCYDRGIKLKANIVYVPGFVGCDEIELVAKALSEISNEIPLHIIGYIPVPGGPKRSPTEIELAQCSKRVSKYLKIVTWSLPKYPDYKKAYKSVTILPKPQF